jgi:hypothetical protein
MRSELTPILLVTMALGCGPTSSTGDSDSDSTAAGTATTQIETSDASQSDGGSVPPLWESWFGTYTTSGAEIGTPINPRSFTLELLELRSDGTVSVEHMVGFCFEDDAPIRHDYRWEPEADTRLRLEGAEPGASPDLWGQGIDEAWIEAGTIDGTLQLNWISPGGEQTGLGDLRPGCLCVPDPAACCEMNCIDLVLQACAPDEVSVLCDEP